MLLEEIGWEAEARWSRAVASPPLPSFVLLTCCHMRSPLFLEFPRVSSFQCSGQLGEVGKSHVGAVPEPSVADMEGRGALFCPLQHLTCSTEKADKDRQS